MPYRERPAPADLHAICTLTSCQHSIRTFCVDQKLLRRSLGAGGNSRAAEEEEGWDRARKRVASEFRGEEKRWRLQFACMEVQESASTDPLKALGPDVVHLVLSRLDARSLARCVLLSKAWSAIALDDVLWRPKCESLWFGKLHLPRAAMKDGLSKATSYSLSLRDSKRVSITKEDLCDHEWIFRFKDSAPEYWLSLDPSWHGDGVPMRRYFHHDSSHTAGANDVIWGGHESNYALIHDQCEGQQQHRQTFVQVNHWPKLTVVRTEDWGWQLSNLFCVYHSVADFQKEGGTGPCLPPSPLPF